MMNRPFIITIEGIDGVGKTTAANFIYKKLKEMLPEHLDIYNTKEPLDKDLFMQNVDCNGNLSDEGFNQLMQTRARECKNTWSNKDVVICDRYWDSSYVYQELYKPENARRRLLNLKSAMLFMPDVTILLRREVDDIPKTRSNTDVLDVYDTQPREKKIEMCNIYQQLADRVPHRILTYDITNNLERDMINIFDLVLDKIKGARNAWFL